MKQWQLDTFSIIFTLRRPQTVRSCLVMISFFLLGDWLGAALGSTWLSVKKLAKPGNVVECVTNTDAQKFYCYQNQWLVQVGYTNSLTCHKFPSDSEVKTCHWYMGGPGFNRWFVLPPCWCTKQKKFVHIVCIKMEVKGEVSQKFDVISKPKNVCLKTETKK